jgi:hypothetical protein
MLLENQQGKIAATKQNFCTRNEALPNKIFTFLLVNNAIIHLLVNNTIIHTDI